jgi:putative membrane protein
LSKNRKDPFIELFDLTRLKDIPYLIMKGFLMGSADIVPGVSGGTMALITGIYDRLIFAIKSFDYKALKFALSFRIRDLFNHIHWKFFLFLGTGMVLAVFFFTRIVPLQVYMFTHAEWVYGIFFGLIVGSIFLLIAEIDPADRNWKYLIALIWGALFGLWIVNLVPADTPETFGFVFLTGSIAISAMVLPGISGSYLLLIFRKYDYILSQLGMLGTSETVNALINLTPFILGCLFGIILFSRVLSWLLKNFHSITILVLIGFLIGSLWVIWPYQEREYVEKIRSTDTVMIDDPIVDELLVVEGPILGPEYKRVGDRVVDSESGEETDMVVIETISRQLISSTPLIPWSGQHSDFDPDRKSDGLIGIFLGMLMISLIFFLRKKKRRIPNVVNDR